METVHTIVGLSTCLQKARANIVLVTLPVAQSLVPLYNRKQILCCCRRLGEVLEESVAMSFISYLSCV